jgi:hypothetical protein
MKIFGNGGHTLPYGYTILDGTSDSGPMAAGAAALLISALKQTRRPYTDVSLRASLLLGARPLQGYMADSDTSWYLAGKFYFSKRSVELERAVHTRLRFV